jgi:hypothetical protein
VLPKDSAQFTSQKIRFPGSRPDDVSYRPDAQQSIASFVRTTWISVQNFPCVKKLQTAPACIRSGCCGCFSSPSGRPSFRISFQNTNMGILLQPSKRRGFPSGCAKPIKQVLQFKTICPDASHHGPNARASNMEIACIRSTVRTTILLVRTQEASIWKLLAAVMRPSG